MIKRPWPKKNNIYCESGKVLGTSGVNRALIPPPIPQKNDTSKNSLFSVNKNIPMKMVERLHM